MKKLDVSLKIKCFRQKDKQTTNYTFGKFSHLLVVLHLLHSFSVRIRLPTSLVSILCHNWINITCICICIVGKYSKYSDLPTWICERTRKDLDASVWCSNVEIIKKFKHVVEEEKRIYLLSEAHRWPTFVFSISWFEVVGILRKSYFFSASISMSTFSLIAIIFNFVQRKIDLLTLWSYEWCWWQRRHYKL